MKYILLMACLTFSLNANAQVKLPEGFKLVDMDEWSFHTTVDDFTDEVTKDGYIQILLSKKDIAGINVTCIDGETILLTLNINSHVDMESTLHRPYNVEYRIDKNKAKKMKLVPIKNTLVSGIKGNDFINDILKGGDTLLMRIIPANKPKTNTIKFPLKGAPEAVGKVVAACKAK